MVKAKDIMTKDVITVRPDATIEELARLFVEHKISGAPVVEEDGRIIGIVTENDLISQNKRLHIPTVVRLFDAFIMLEGKSRIEQEIKKMAAVTAGQICSKDIISVSQDADVSEIADIMSEKKVHLIPVIEGGKLFGIIGKIDLIRGMMK